LFKSLSNRTLINWDVEKIEKMEPRDEKNVYSGDPRSGSRSEDNGEEHITRSPKLRNNKAAIP